ncbi:hypothetical protein VTK26DRAFT_3154 [Humicola hyalothermophila]
MPTYLCHGFRWQRRSIRVFVIVQNLDDASPEWIIPARTSQCILQSFYDLFDFLPYCLPPKGRYGRACRDANSDDETRTLHYSNRASHGRNQSRGRSRSQSQSNGASQSRSVSRATRAQLQQPPRPQPPPEDDFSAQSWSVVKLLEEYDDRDLTAVSRPYAYVADYAVRIDLSCSVTEEIARYEQQQKEKKSWLPELRDQLQRDEEIRWYVVVNNDEVRDWTGANSDDDGDGGDDEEEEGQPSLSVQAPQFQHHHQYQQQQQHDQYQYETHLRRPSPTKEQKQHHAQYILQQLIFEKEEKQRQSKEQQQQQQQQQQPQQSTQQEQPPSNPTTPAPNKPHQNPPKVPDKDYLPPVPKPDAATAAAPPAPQPLRSKLSFDFGGSRGGSRSSKAGGFRRLFGRSGGRADAGERLRWKR